MATTARPRQYHPSISKPGERARYRETRRVTLVGALVNVVLAAAKILFGVLGQSQALIADGVHSLSDLLSDALVLVGARHGTKDADADHPYGHARIETAVTVGLGVVLMAVAAGIAIDAVARLFQTERLLHPGPLALAVALVSVLSKEALYHYTVRVADQVRSNLLRANAWHHRSDAISSVVVIVGVAGAMAGLEYLDAIAAVGVALMIAKVGWDLGWQSLRELVDTGLEPARLAAIRQAILEVDGVRALHMLRTRRMGADALADVHIQVAPRLSVSEGHHIGETVRARLIREIDELTDVTVHVDPEDDERQTPSLRLPMRGELLAGLQRAWAGIPEASAIERTTLHYLDGRVDVDVLLPLAAAGDEPRRAELQARLAAAARQVPAVGRIAVYYR